MRTEYKYLTNEFQQPAQMTQMNVLAELTANPSSIMTTAVNTHGVCGGISPAVPTAQNERKIRQGEEKR